MIVLHSFFFKAHPKYLDKAVDMMRKFEGCGFFNHANFETFVERLRAEIRESAGDRGVGLYKGNGVLKITTKGGNDYAARIDFIKVEKVFTVHCFSGKLVQSFELTPQGDIKYVTKEADR